MLIRPGLRRFVAGWTPAKLFAGGVAGAWYEPSPTTCYTDVAMTTPAGVGDTVAAVADLSGNGNHATQATAGYRPILRRDVSGHYYLEFDGVDDVLSVTFADAISQPSHRVSAIQINSVAQQLYFGGLSSTSRQQLYMSDGTHLAMYAGTAKNNLFLHYGPIVVTEYYSGSSSYYRVNGAQVTSGNAGAYGATGLTIGKGYDGSIPSDFSFYGLVYLGAALSDANISLVESYISRKNGAYVNGFTPSGTDNITYVESTANYDAFGFSVEADNGNTLYIARRGSSHVGDNGELRKWEYSGTWSQATITDDVTYDDRNAGGGKSSTGTLLAFYGRYDYVTPAWVDMRVMRSTDNGGSWADQGAISANGCTAFSPYGPLVELPSGRLMQTVYGQVGSTYKVWVTYSDDDGQTWGGEADVVSSTSVYATEAAASYVSGDSDATSKVVLVTRTNNGKLRQYITSDGGSTWADGGELQFSTGSNKDVSPWLYLDGSTLHLVYADRTDMTLKHVSGSAEAIHGTKAAWGNAEIIWWAKSSAANDFGYPSAYKSNGVFVLHFYDKTGAAPDVYTSI